MERFGAHFLSKYRASLSFSFLNSFVFLVCYLDALVFSKGGVSCHINNCIGDTIDSAFRDTILISLRHLRRSHWNKHKIINDITNFSLQD